MLGKGLELVMLNKIREDQIHFNVQTLNGNDKNECSYTTLIYAF